MADVPVQLQWLEAAAEPGRTRVPVWRLSGGRRPSYLGDGHFCSSQAFTDWMRSIHMGQGKLLFTQSTNLNIHLIQKHPQLYLSKYLGTPVKSIRKCNHCIFALTTPGLCASRVVFIPFNSMNMLFIPRHKHTSLIYHDCQLLVRLCRSSTVSPMRPVKILTISLWLSTASSLDVFPLP